MAKHPTLQLAAGGPLPPRAVEGHVVARAWTWTPVRCIAPVLRFAALRKRKQGAPCLGVGDAGCMEIHTLHIEVRHHDHPPVIARTKAPSARQQRRIAGIHLLQARLQLLVARYALAMQPFEAVAALLGMLFGKHDAVFAPQVAGATLLDLRDDPLAVGIPDYQQIAPLGRNNQSPLKNP
ncbi:hypothetical protein, partial [Xanthomonas fragariae]